ncbi:MAG: hypothetical protein MJB14_08980, partial [Spirochaetes bacterium]|nr:hypothetical protein [Spirochaetota bacterium]
DTFQIHPIKIIKKNTKISNAFQLRLFCKTSEIDELIDIMIRTQGGNELTEEQINDFNELLIQHRLFRYIARQKVYLQIKKGLNKKNILEKVLVIPFENQSFKGIVILSKEKLEKLLKILGIEYDTDSLDISNQILVLIRKKIYQLLSIPPEKFGRFMLALSNAELQMVLNRILHESLASHDMLASYIHQLGEQADRILSNVSQSVREILFQKLRSQRMFSTRRWALQVNYIINRNLFKAIDELGVEIKGMQKIKIIRLKYLETEIQKNFRHKNIANLLAEINSNDQYQMFTKLCPQRDFILAFSFIKKDDSQWNEVLSILSQHISQTGITQLKEDVEFFQKEINITHENRIIGLLKCLKIIRSIQLTKEVQNWVKEGFFDKCQQLLPFEFAKSSLNFIVDEIGFGKVIFALYRLPDDWLKKVMEPVLYSLYEDVLKKKIRFIRFGDFRETECRIDFLKTAVILQEQGII